MPKRVAITISGAVSLGSYEAGVLYELLYAIGQHNQQQSLPESDKIYIDVLTGASAGGMTVAVAGQNLLYQGSSLDNPYDNPLYRAWVTDIDLKGLLDLQQSEYPTHSILSSTLVENLSKKYLLGRYSAPSVAARQAHPAVSPNGMIQLGFALSNLNGVDYDRPMLSGGKFIYTQFQDELTATLNGRASCDTQAFWEPIRQAAVSCGAFPFAFRVQDLIRNKTDYPSSYLDAWGSLSSRSFAYTDGGIFQNEPLGLAKNLVDPIDKHQDSESRAYLYISPGPKVSTQNTTFQARIADFRATAVQLMESIINQARFHDWIKAEAVNAQIDLLNRRAEQLHTVIMNRTLSVAPLGTVSGPLLQSFFSKPLELSAARQQLKDQFSLLYAQLAGNRGPGLAAADAWIDAILVFEMAADLHQKDEMYIYSLTADDSELAGAGLMAFLGFFDQDYRQHDYDVGRVKAQRFLTNPQSAKLGPLPPIKYVPKPVRPINHALDGLTLNNVPAQKRKEFRDRLQERADVILQELHLSWPLRKAIELFYLNGKLNKILVLPSCWQWIITTMLSSGIIGWLVSRWRSSRKGGSRKKG